MYDELMESISFGLLKQKTLNKIHSVTSHPSLFIGGLRLLKNHRRSGALDFFVKIMEEVIHIREEGLPIERGR